ncbi:MAG: hypothetical protein V7735_25480 [Photobacterium frigidiphilum]
MHCKNQYLFNAFALANVWRARLLCHITDTLKLAIPHRLSQKWVVDCRHVGRGISLFVTWIARLKRIKLEHYLS